MFFALSPMNIHDYTTNQRITLKVIPKAKTTRLIEENNALKLYLKSPPENNKANIELVKFFKKEYNLTVAILSGARSKRKQLAVILSPLSLHP